MTSVRLSLPRRPGRWLVLGGVGLLGLLVTGWVTRSFSEHEQEWLEHRFQMAAHARAEEIAHELRQPLDDLVMLQRLFDVTDVDWPAFKRFTASMLSKRGVLNLNWVPLVTDAERGAFEARGKEIWGKDFAIREIESAGHLVPAARRDHYFSALYAVPEESARHGIGLDVYSLPHRAEMIDAAIAGNQPVVSDIGPLTINPDISEALLIVLPVYNEEESSTPEARQGGAKGVVIAVADIGRLFAAANAGLTEAGFNVRLLDAQRPDGDNELAVWNARNPWTGPESHRAVLTSSQRIDLGGKRWLVRVEATPGWVESNQSHGLALIPAFGFLATIVLVLGLDFLLRRSALVNVLAATHEDDIKRRRAAEARADMLSMAVDQNPTSIYITDLDGCVEYVNNGFVEATGCQRETVIGRKAQALPCGFADDALQAEIGSALAAGSDWHGESSVRNADGSVKWLRTVVFPIRDESGITTRYMTVQEDITELRELMNRLLESESRFRAAMSVMIEGLTIIGPDGTYLYANRAAEEYLKCRVDELTGLRPEQCPVQRLREDGTVCPRDEFPSRATLLEGREVRGFILGHRYADGSVRWFEVNSSPMPAPSGGRWCAVQTLSDITERRRVEEELKLAFAAIRCSGEGILVTDAEQHVVSVNPAFESVTGYSAQEILGQPPAVFASSRHDAAFYAAMQEVLEKTGHWQGEVWSQRKNGEVYLEWLGVSVVRDEDDRPRYYVYIFSDMAVRNEAQQRIEFLAHHDPLTGLPNRLLLRDRVEQAQAQAARMQSHVALMFLDLDRFKTINDSLGHPVGDAMLKEAVGRLRSCVRESDTISRQGGDEFIILLNDVRDGEAVSRVADKIHQRMAEPFVIGEHTLIGSFSIGIALYPEDGSDFDSLLQKADTAMYHAKEAGRNGYRFFTEEMNQQVVEHLTLETQLRRAIDNREFVVHYQPQLDLSEGRIIGVEALLRWNSPESGLVSPGKFIPVAENSGLIVPIGAWVLGEVCRQARAWQDAGLPPFVVAVNLSAIQFKRLDLVNTVINALVLADLDSQWLELELTESILIQDAEVTLDTVRRLKALGVKLSVDDFGTGYSSLAYLKRFAVDKLKIDQSFVRDLVSDPDDAAIVRAIIQMAHSLKLKTIAEGVENEELANLLHVFHCDEIQGFWFAHPMPAAELESFMRAHLAGTKLGERG